MCVPETMVPKSWFCSAGYDPTLPLAFQRTWGDFGDAHRNSTNTHVACTAEILVCVPESLVEGNVRILLVSQGLCCASTWWEWGTHTQTLTPGGAEFGCASPLQRLDEVKDVAVQIADTELAGVVERVVDVFDEIDAVRRAGGCGVDLTRLQKPVQIVDLVGVQP